jgi:catechol 2,3-dioxygenase-like lactoylglutathione lyase family enzyme
MRSPEAPHRAKQDRAWPPCRYPWADESRQLQGSAATMSGAMELRVTRHTDRLEEVVVFYRDRVGLPELGRFTDHDGYSGVFLDLPGTGSHLEFTAGGDLPAPEPHRESLLVLYLDTQQELDAVAARLGPSETTPANPYWQRTALAFADPDGYQLLLTLRPGRAP